MYCMHLKQPVTLPTGAARASLANFLSLVACVTGIMQASGVHACCMVLGHTIQRLAIDLTFASSPSHLQETGGVSIICRTHIVHDC
jgi:hypothetical protein